MRNLTDTVIACAAGFMSIAVILLFRPFIATVWPDYLGLIPAIAWSGPAMAVGMSLWCFALLAEVNEWSMVERSLRLGAALALLAAVACSFNEFLIKSLRVAWTAQYAGLSQVARIKALPNVFAGLVSKYWLWSTVAATPGVLCITILMSSWRSLVREPLGPWRSRRATQRRTRALRARPGWMTTGTLDMMVKEPAGMPLGLFAGKIVRYVPSREDKLLGGHHAVIAGTRGDKGVACVKTALLDHDGPTVTLDVKGENFAECSAFRARLGRKQVIVNPFGLITEKTAFFNCMRYLRTGPMLLRDISVLADGLVLGIGGDDAWIANGGRRLVEPALELIVTLDPPEPWSLVTLRKMLCGPERMAMFETWKNSPDLCGGRLAEAGGNILSMGDRQRGAVLDHVDASLDWLKYPQMQKIISDDGPGIDFDALLAGKTDLYLVIPQDMVHTLAGYFRPLLNTILGAVTRQDGKSQLAQPLLMLLDEFTRLGHMQKMMEIATISAGGGVEAMFVVQDLETLEKTYPGESRTLLGSCATIRVFSVGAGDDITCNWAESLMQTYIRTKWQNTHGADGKVSRTRVEVREKLLTGPDLREMDPSLMLCLLRSNPAALLDKIVSHEHPLYRNRLAGNPVARA